MLLPPLALPLLDPPELAEPLELVEPLPDPPPLLVLPLPPLDPFPLLDTPLLDVSWPLLLPPDVAPPEVVVPLEPLEVPVPDEDPVVPLLDVVPPPEELDPPPPDAPVVASSPLTGGASFVTKVEPPHCTAAINVKAPSATAIFDFKAAPPRRSHFHRPGWRCRGRAPSSVVRRDPM